MAVLSPYSSKFTNVLDEVQDRMSTGELQSFDERTKFIQDKGLDANEFRKTAIEYDKLMEEDPDELRRPGFGIGRAAGRFAGSLGEGIANISQAVAPEFSKKVGQVYRDVTPDKVEKDLQALFKPTDTGFGTIGEIGGFVAGGGAGIKLLGAAAKGAKLKKLDTATRAGKIGKAAKIGTGFAIGTTAIEKPEDNFVNFLADYVNEDVSDEQGKKIGTFGSILERLKVNPNDSAAQKYARAFANNLLVEGGFAGAFPILGGLFKAGANTEVAKFLTKGVKQTADYIGESIPIKGLTDKLKRYGTSRMGMSEKGSDLLQIRDGAQKAAIIRAEELSVTLEKTAKKEGLKSDDGTLEMLNGALADPKVMSKIKEKFPETGKVLQKMRDEIDSLSKTVQTDIAKGKKFKTTIGNNFQTYLNRTYRIFDDPDYSLAKMRKQNPKAVEDAETYFRNLGVADGEEMKQVLNAYTDVLKGGEFKSFMKNLKPRTQKILKKRGDIPTEIRNLWGEVKNPYVNYVNSYTKLANLISEHNFRGEIRKEALATGKGVLDKLQAAPKGMGKVGLTAEGKQVPYQQVEGLGLGGIKTNIDNPLDGLFLDDAWKKGIEEGNEVFLGKNFLIDNWMKTKALSQAAKTVFSLPTHGRNMIGNLFIMTANGTVNPFKLGGGAKDTYKRFTGTMDKDTRARLARYLELGIVDSQLDARQLRKSAQEGFKLGPHGVIDKITDRSLVGRGLKKGVQKTVQAYEAEDNLFKIANFENLMSQYRKAFPKVKKLPKEKQENYLKRVSQNEEQLERFVAQRARDMMPNYNLVPKAFKALRAMPVGNFVAFPAEMVRNTYHLAKNAWKDISGQTAKDLGITDPEAIKQLKNIGLKRLAGMTTAAVAGDAAVNESKQLFGITDQQEAALNKTVADWEKGTNKIFLSPMQRNDKGEIEVEYMNLGPMDPYSYIKTPVKKIINAVINNQDYNEAELNDMYASALYDIINPFASPSMVAQSALDAYRGKKSVADEGVTPKIARVLKSSFTPGTVDQINKYFKFKESQKQRGVGEEVNQYGFGINPGEVDFAAFLGVKRQKANLSDSFSFVTGKPIRDMRKSKSRFTNKIRDYSVSDPNEIYKAYEESQTNKLEHAQRLRGIVRAYRELGMDEMDMYTSLTKGGVLSGKGDEFNDIIFADQNIFMADDIPDQSIMLSERKTRTPIPYNKIYDLYSRLTGKQID